MQALGDLRDVEGFGGLILVVDDGCHFVHYQALLAEIAQERDAAQAKAAEAAAEVARLKARGFFARLFGGAG
jgi:hypothetical protein